MDGPGLRRASPHHQENSQWRIPGKPQSRVRPPAAPMNYSGATRTPLRSCASIAFCTTPLRLAALIIAASLA